MYYLSTTTLYYLLILNGDLALKINSQPSDSAVYILSLRNEIFSISIKCQIWSYNAICIFGAKQ